MSAPWEPYDDLIARGLAAGETFSEIAQAILRAGRAETSRNAVIGRARRLGLESAVKPGCGQVRLARKPAPRAAQEPAKPAAIRKSQAKGKSKSGQARAKAAGSARSEHLPHVERFRAFRAAFLPPAQPVPLRDIAAGACRRPVGGGWGADLLMCGARVQGAGAYCRACAKLMYAPRPEGTTVPPRLAGVGISVAAAANVPAEGEVDLVDQFGEGA